MEDHMQQIQQAGVGRYKGRGGEIERGDISSTYGEICSLFDHFL